MDKYEIGVYNHYEKTGFQKETKCSEDIVVLIVTIGNSDLS
jgi:hypothetical protein